MGTERLEPCSPTIVSVVTHRVIATIENRASDEYVSADLMGFRYFPLKLTVVYC